MRSLETQSTRRCLMQSNVLPPRQVINRQTSTRPTRRSRRWCQRILRSLIKSTDLHPTISQSIKQVKIPFDINPIYLTTLKKRRKEQVRQKKNKKNEEEK
ncbi:hypothetical protein SAMD00019534_041930 [Acytostelium subglobosum LB1]|uniref:hypothetical protein n=1 Tax=Acytostelium subglobosum LB1 TaxID=1410327 RepID=UPI000644CF4C|nr:hypothetical protein SAMD00019534_041930 [Acytostelium subglobosum LB1]GAM21018.1 hypothetical protein SAMD00019534_041930 [Acytostelium subglobosum LB1]|eukprot:XP_012756152.1 hypothetical protein SAMD00019534_041930 [Acytostelium subglobosum LB1]